MTPFFTRERFGTPQFIAAFLLLAFLAQCAWFIAHVPLTASEANYVAAGVEMLRSGHDAGDQLRSPLIPLISATPSWILMKLSHDTAAEASSFRPPELDRYRWLIRTPFVFMGLMLGASVWYVSRRLYGNAGGYVALGLFAFSPAIVARSSLAQPEVAAAWGIFGTIFTAIAVAHTLYAPREVILWNYRRITLMGVAIALAVGAQFSCAIMLLLALAYMWWAVPHRRPAAFAILLCSCGVAVVLLSAAYFGSPFALLRGFARAHWIRSAAGWASSGVVFKLIATFYLRDAAAITLLTLIALVTYAVWRRTRFFGNTAPLLTAAVLLFLAVVAPQSGGFTFVFLSLPFAMVFAAGVFADLIESKQGQIAVGAALGVAVMQAILSISELLKVGRVQ